MAVGIFLKDESRARLWTDLTSNYRIFLLYFVPATLYCLYNNLAFVNLVSYDPTTYYLLLQLRVVVTGVIYQFLFKKQLSAWQWFSLLLLTGGCVVKNVGQLTDSSGAMTIGHVVNYNLVLILIQVFCSCFAGVYNEYLLKDPANSSTGTTAPVHIMIQNMYMYMDSVSEFLLRLPQS